MVQTRSMQRKSGGALCGDFVPQRRRTQRITVREVNSETILRDAIDGVCEFLNMKDLHAVSQVCSLWKAAAAREVTKRRQIQRLLIPHNLEDIANSNSICHIPGALRVKPYVALLFVGSKLLEEFNLGRSSNLMYENCPSTSARTLALPLGSKNPGNHFLSSVFDVYKQQLPHNMVGMEVCEHLTDIDGTFMSKELRKQFSLEAAGNQSILGLFLPMERGMQVRLTWCEGLCDSITDVADRMIDQLIFEDQPQNHGSTMLVFAQSLTGYFLAEQVINNMRQRYPDRNEHVWGGIVGKELGATNCHWNDSSSDDRKIFVGLRITSPGLQTWMTVIDCTARRDEVTQKLQEFRQRVQRKRHTMGLAYGPYYINPRTRNNYDLFHDSQDLMRAIKDVFVNIQFSGIFNRECRMLVSCDAMDEEMSQKMNQEKLMALIVIAYD